MDYSLPGFSVHGSGLPCPPKGNIPDPGIKPMSLMSAALAGGFFTTSPTWEATLEPWAPNISHYAFKISFIGTFDSTAPPGVIQELGMDLIDQKLCGDTPEGGCDGDLPHPCLTVPGDSWHTLGRQQ